VRQEVEDMVQDVFLALFRDECKILRSWNPAKGLSFKNFVGMVAERQVASALRSGKRSPWKEDPLPHSELDRPSPEKSSESRTASRDTLRHILRRMQAQLSPLGWRLFQMLFVDELTVAEIRHATDMSPDAIYAWRSRLRRQANEVRQEIETEIEPSRRKSLSGGSSQ
jgi:RNA polymerase sigma-70 factor (ECF subfamily)